MAGIRIDFLADVGKFVGKTKDVEKALEDVADSLDGLADEAKRSGEKLGDELADGAREGGDAAAKLEKKFRDAFNEVRGDARKAGDNIGDEVSRGSKKAGTAVDEFADEAKQSARESAASFSGEFSDVADFIQETLANALVGFGPAGVAVGVAAAAGIGLLVGELEKGADRAEQARERVGELADAITDAGGRLERVDWTDKIREFANEVGDSKEMWEVWQRTARTNLEVIRDDAERLGLSFKDVMAGMAGEPEALGRALAEVDGRLAEAQDTMQGLIMQGMDPLVASTQAGVTELAAYRQKLQGVAEVNERATTAAEELADVIGVQADAMLRASGSALALDQAVLDANKAIQENGATLDTTTQAGIDNRRALLDIADAARSVTGTASEVDAAMSRGREAFLKAASAAGMGADEAGRLADELFSVPKVTNITVNAKVNDPDLAARMRSWQGYLNTHPLYVPARASLQSGGRVPGLASGGPAEAGEPYLVGEEGQELFVPNQSGTVIPADDTKRILNGARAGGSTTVVNMPITVNERFDAAEASRQIAWALR